MTKKEVIWKSYKFLISALESSSRLCPYLGSTKSDDLTSKPWNLIPEYKNKDKFLTRWMRKLLTSQHLNTAQIIATSIQMSKEVFLHQNHIEIIIVCTA